MTFHAPFPHPHSRRLLASNLANFAAVGAPVVASSTSTNLLTCRPFMLLMLLAAELAADHAALRPRRPVEPRAAHGQHAPHFFERRAAERVIAVVEPCEHGRLDGRYCPEHGDCEGLGLGGGADGLVGQAVIQYAAMAGFKTVNILAHRPDWDNFVYHLHGIGGTLVVNEGYAQTPAFSKLLADLPPPALGINAVGGAAVGAVARQLARGSRLVTYAAASAREPVCIPLGLFTQRWVGRRGARAGV